MPYLHCQSCRLTIYEGRMFPLYVDTGTCPRCAGQLQSKPASLFDPSRRDGGLGLVAPRRGRKRRPAAPLPATQETEPLREARG